MVVEMAPDASMASSSTDPAINSVASQPVSKLAHRRQMFNMNSIKAHFLGDYGTTIQLFRPTNPHSTFL